jgi:hypothetical protein
VDWAELEEEAARAAASGFSLFLGHGCGGQNTQIK